MVLDTERQNMSNYRMANTLSTSSTLATVPCEEEIAPDADEPPESLEQVFKKKLPLKRASTEVNLSKWQTPCPIQSLLSKALVTDKQEHQRSRSITITLPTPKRGFSTTSTMSNASAASTAELTSDGGITSPSRTSTPSPPIHDSAFGSRFNSAHHSHQSSHLVAIKDHSEDEHVDEQIDVVAERVVLKRCITFDCGMKLRPTEPKKAAIATIVVQEPAPVRKCLLKFACSRPAKDVAEVEKPQRKFVSPPPPTKTQRRQSSQVTLSIKDEEHHRRDSTATIVNAKTTPIATPSLPVSVPEHPSASVSEVESNKFYEFASSVEEKSEAWMNIPNTSDKLMKIDCILEKERRVRKLCQEADEEVAADEADDDEDESDDAGYMEDNEDDDDDDEMWSNSDLDDEEDNEDDEEDECSDDEDSDCYPSLPIANSPRIGHPLNCKPLCCRTTSDSSLDKVQVHISPPRRKSIPIRSATPILPDSTDFVPGTFDEDKVDEAAYISCMEERKAAKLLKKKITPQDIDPTFPTSDAEDEEPARSIPSSMNRGKRSDIEETLARVRGRQSSTASRRSPPMSPRGFHHSPPPSSRRMHSPPPTSRRASRQLSPVPSIYRMRSPPPSGRRASRQLSPAPSHRSLVSGTPSPSKHIPQAIVFRPNPFARDNGPGMARTKSLPRNGAHPAFVRRRTAQMLPTATSPRPHRLHNMRSRGAVDIVEGLEQKRLRRKEKHYGKPWKAGAGEGVEKMRELGILGKERLGGQPVKLMLSI